MPKILFILAIFGLATTVAFGQSRENRQVSGFTGINASSVFQITVQRGSTESLVIEADNNVMPYVRSEVRDGVLHLFLDREFERRQENTNPETLNAIIVMQNLEYVTLSGVNNLVAEDLFTPDRFRFIGSGVSSLSINLNTSQLEMSVSGVSNIELNTNVSEYARFNVSGVGNISGNLVAQQATFDYRGVGTVTLSGSAANAVVNLSGAPNLNLVDFVARDALINAPGAGSVTVNATNSLTINASGVSTIRYTGSATVVERNTGRMSRISRI